MAIARQHLEPLLHPRTTCVSILRSFDLALLIRLECLYVHFDLPSFLGIGASHILARLFVFRGF